MSHALATFIEDRLLADGVAVPVDETAIMRFSKRIIKTTYLLMGATGGLPWFFPALSAAQLFSVQPPEVLKILFGIGAATAISVEDNWVTMQLARKLSPKTASEIELKGNKSNFTSALVTTLSIASAASMVISAYLFNPPIANYLAAGSVGVVNPAYGYWGFTELYENGRALRIKVAGTQLQRKQSEIRWKIVNAIRRHELNNPDPHYNSASSAEDYFARLLQPDIYKDTSSLARKIIRDGGASILAATSFLTGLAITSNFLAQLFGPVIGPILGLISGITLALNSESPFFVVTLLPTREALSDALDLLTCNPRETLFSRRYGRYKTTWADLFVTAFASVAAPMAMIYLTFMTFRDYKLPGTNIQAPLFLNWILSLMNGLARVALSRYTLKWVAQHRILQLDAAIRRDDDLPEVLVKQGYLTDLIEYVLTADFKRHIGHLLPLNVQAELIRLEASADTNASEDAVPLTGVVDGVTRDASSLQMAHQEAPSGTGAFFQGAQDSSNTVGSRTILGVIPGATPATSEDTGESAGAHSKGTPIWKGF